MFRVSFQYHDHIIKLFFKLYVIFILLDSKGMYYINYTGVGIIIYNDHVQNMCIP